MFQKKNECSLEAHRFKSLVSIKLFTWNIITITGIQDKNIKNSMKLKSKNYHKPREFEKLYIDWLVYCYKAKCTMQGVEQNIRKDVCRLDSKLTSKTNTQIENFYFINTSKSFVFGKNSAEFYAQFYSINT